MLLQLILITHPKTGDQRESLKYVYNLYVEYVVKNPLYVPGTPIQYVFLLSFLNYHCPQNGYAPNSFFNISSGYKSFS